MHPLCNNCKICKCKISESFLGTKGIEWALGAHGLLTLADIAPVKKKPMVGATHVVSRNVFYERLLYFEGCVGSAGHKSQAMAHAIYMSVYGHGALREGYGKHDIGSLAPNAWQTQQMVHVGRHLPLVIVYEHLREFYEMLGFGIRIADTLHIFIHLILLCLSHRLSIGVGTKQSGRDDVHTFVCALGRKHHSHEQLKGAAVVEFCVYIALFATEIIQYAVVSFL